MSETQAAFDSVADSYDGPRGNNALIQRMRELSWRTIGGCVAAPARLLDLGCGTGHDALHFAQAGFEVLATDWSPQMVARTTARAHASGITARLDARCIGAQELQQIEAAADGSFDAIYSNFGPLNCVPDLRVVSQQCARLLRPGGCLVFTVIGRLCPWELGHYLIRGRWRRALVRFARQMTAVNLNRHRVWTRYYTPRQFYRPFAADFELVKFSALSLFLPPPYLIDFHERRPGLSRVLGWMDDRLGSLPLLRNAGDHFLIVLRARQS